MNETLKTIASLASIHGGFLEREISEEDLTVILESCTKAANASGRQAYSIIVLSDQDKMHSLFGYRGSRASLRLQ